MAGDPFAAMVRIGDPVRNKELGDVAKILALHVKTSCWTSSEQRSLPAGMPVIASHIAAGRGQFLVGLSTGMLFDRLPWEPAPDHTGHVGHEVRWMNVVFEGDVTAITGAERRAIQWLTVDNFNDTLRKLTARPGRASPAPAT